MNLAHFFARLILLFVLVQPGFAAETPAPVTTPAVIPVVATWGELRAAPPVIDESFAVWIARRQSGPSPFAPKDQRIVIRLGIDRTRADLDGAVLLYCLLDSPIVPECPFPGRDSLGPFTIEVESPQAPKEVTRSYLAEARLNTPIPSDSLPFFMKVVPLTQAGTHRIKVMRWTEVSKDSKSQEIATATVEVSATGTPKWHPWERPAETDSLQRATDDPLLTADIIPPSSGCAALPSIDGWVERWVPVHEELDPRTPLPRLFPATPGLSVQPLVNGVVVQVVNGAPVICEPQDQFLTRWWVNDREFTPAGKEPPLQQAVQLSHQLAPTGQARLRFDPAPFGLKEGDTVGLQLLLCPAGWAFTAPELEMAKFSLSSHDAGTADLSLLSQRVDFVFRQGRLEPAGSPPAPLHP